MIEERISIEVRPAELCVRAASLASAPVEAWVDGVVVTNDDEVYVKGHYRGRLVALHDEGDELWRAGFDNPRWLGTATVVDVQRHA